ncbi:BofC C-terminal domain-containing protein [Gottschalkia acidurici]|nr:BofC C-terminal domain-containing protein [Gottschalkia acidurici]
MFKKNPIMFPILLCIALIVFGVVGGYILGIDGSDQKMRKESKIKNNAINYNDENNNDRNKVKTSLVDGNAIVVSTNIIYKVKYKECGHEVVKNEKPGDDMIGLNRKEFEKYVEDNFIDWQISSFSREEITLMSEKSTLCPNHFVVGEMNGKIVIFKINEDGERVVHKIFKDTTISTLREENREKIKKGIVVDTEEDAIQILENFIT